MKTNIVDVSGLLSPLSARGVEKQLARLCGVKKVEVNYVARNQPPMGDTDRKGV